MRSYALLLLLWVLIFAGCKLDPISMQIRNNNKTKKIEAAYTNDTLHIQNYIYFRDSIYRWNWLADKVSYRYEDSIMNQFKTALQKAPIHIQWHQPMLNVCDSIIPNLGLSFRPKRIPDSLILSKVDADSAKTILFPIVQTRISRTYSVNGGYSFSYVNWAGADNFNIVIYIIKNKRIIYKRAVRCVAMHKEDEKFHGLHNYTSRMQPEFWDIAVQKVLEDYIKRIKLPVHKLEQNN